MRSACSRRSSTRWSACAAAVPAADLRSGGAAHGVRPCRVLGDAAFVARPHVGAGVAKAADDALALADALEADDVESALKKFEAARLSVGNKIIAARAPSRRLRAGGPEDAGRARLCRAAPQARGGAERNRDDEFLKRDDVSIQRRDTAAHRKPLRCIHASDRGRAAQRSSTPPSRSRWSRPMTGRAKPRLILTGRVRGVAFAWRPMGAAGRADRRRRDTARGGVARIARGDRARSCAKRNARHARRLPDTVRISDHAGGGVGRRSSAAAAQPARGRIGAPHPACRYRARGRGRVRHHSGKRAACGAPAREWPHHPRADRGADLPVPRGAAGRQTRVADLEQPVFAWRYDARSQAASSRFRR